MARRRRDTAARQRHDFPNRHAGDKMAAVQRECKVESKRWIARSLRLDPGPALTSRRALRMAEVSSSGGEQAARERDLVSIVHALVRELRGGRPIEVALASRLDRDLGIDSLGRTELVLRLERAFQVRLPTQVIGEAETVRDLLDALGEAKAVPDLVPAAAPVQSAAPAGAAVSGSPSEA